MLDAVLLACGMVQMVALPAVLLCLWWALKDREWRRVVLLAMSALTAAIGCAMLFVLVTR